MDHLPIRSALRHRFVSTNGITLHVAETGSPDGVPVLMLHGFPEFWYGWRHQIDYLADRGYRLIMPDQRGYNLSGKPPGRMAYRISELTADMLGLIDEMGMDRIFLVGHDWGGIVAWYLAMDSPHRISALVNLNIPHPLVMKRTLRTSWEQRKKSWYIFFFQLPLLPEYLLSRNQFANMKKVLGASSRKGTFTDADLVRYAAAWRQPGAVRSMLNWYRAAFLLFARQMGNPEISVPTRLIWGKKDIALGHEMARPSIDLCRSGYLHFFEKASHWVQHERAEQVNELINGFFSRPKSG